MCPLKHRYTAQEIHWWCHCIIKGKGANDLYPMETHAVVSVPISSCHLSTTATLGTEKFSTGLYVPKPDEQLTWNKSRSRLFNCNWTIISLKIWAILFREPSLDYIGSSDYVSQQGYRSHVPPTERKAAELRTFTSLLFIELNDCRWGKVTSIARLGLGLVKLWLG